MVSNDGERNSYIIQEALDLMPDEEEVV